MNELSIGENEKQIQSTSPPSSTAKRTQSLRYLTQQPSASQPNMLIHCIAETPIRGYRGCALPYWDGPKETAAFLVPAHIPGTRERPSLLCTLMPFAPDQEGNRSIHQVRCFVMSFFPLHLRSSKSGPRRGNFPSAVALLLQPSGKSAVPTAGMS